jgi:hypothetical protein
MPATPSGVTSIFDCPTDMHPPSSIPRQGMSTSRGFITDTYFNLRNHRYGFNAWANRMADEILARSS